MKTRLKAIDEIVVEDTGQLIIFGGEKKVHLDILLKQIINNMLKQGRKCLSVEDGCSVSIDSFKRFECEGYNWGLKKEDYDLHFIWIDEDEKFDLSKLWAIDLFPFDDVFIMCPGKDFTKETYAGLKKIAVQKNVNIFVKPWYEVGKYKKKHRKLLLESADYYFEIEKTYNFFLRFNHASEFDVDIFKGSTLNKKTARLEFLGIEKIFDVGEDICEYL